MLRINSINSVNNYQNQKKTAFKGNNVQTNPQIEQLSNVQTDYAVKTPMKYSKLGEKTFPYDTKAHLYKLANGQKVIIIPQEGETVVRSYVNTGSMNEPDNIRGISHYIEHNLFNGSKGLEEGDFFKQVDKMGASTNASTGFAETNYYISSNLLNESDLENKIKLQASMLETPLFATEKLEKEKGIVNSEINMILSDPENIGINKMLKNLYGIKTTSTDMIGGTTDNITNLTRNDVVDYFNNNYYPANIVTVITGDVKPDETIKLVSKHFASNKKPVKERHFEDLTPIQKTVREDLISDKATSTYITVGFNGPKSNDAKNRIYTQALAVLLSSSITSRINKKTKDLNNITSIQDEKISSNSNDNRALILSANCSEENSEKVLKTIFSEIGNIKNNPPTEVEMKIIKKQLTKAFSQIFENSFDTNNAIGTSLLENNENYLNNFKEIVDNMTSQDLINTANKYMDINKASVTVVHPASANENSIKENYKNVSFTGAKKEMIDMSNVKEYNTYNNYRVATVNSKTNNVYFNFKLTTDNEFDGNPTAQLVLNQIFTEGSKYRTQEELITDENLNGINSSINTINNKIFGKFNCDSVDIQKAMNNFKEVIENPRINDKEFNHAKNMLIETITLSKKSAMDNIDCVLYKGLTEGLSKEEVLDKLNQLTIQDVKDYYNYIIENAKGEIVVSAPFNKKPELKNKIFSNISSFKQVKEHTPKELLDTYKPIENTKVVIDNDYSNQANIIEGYKFKVNQNAKDKIAIELLNIILGGNPSSRLFMDLREKQKLAYRVRSNFEQNNNIGVMYLSIGTTTDNKDTGEQHFDNVEKSISGFNKHIQKIKTEKVSDEELNNAKLFLKNMLLNSTHSANGRNNVLLKGMNSPYGLLKGNEYFKEIDNITKDDIYYAANYIFAGKPTYSILATEDTINANKEYLESLKQN